MASDAPLLQLNGASAFYRRVQALHAVDIAVGAGQSLAVLGANGAGKTTLLRAISGVIVRREGSIRFDGAEIAALPPHEIVRHGIAHVPEGKHLFKPLTVQENLDSGALFARSAAGARDLVHALFPILVSRHGQVAGTLSGGEQQMLAIGRALMSQPRILLLDEPTVGLAPRVNEMLFAAFRQLRELGMTLVIAEQAVRLACSVADEAIVLHLGQIALRGPAIEIRDDPDLKRLYLGE